MSGFRLLDDEPAQEPAAKIDEEQLSSAEKKAADEYYDLYKDKRNPSAVIKDLERKLKNLGVDKADYEEKAKDRGKTEAVRATYKKLAEETGLSEVALRVAIQRLKALSKARVIIKL